MKKLMMLLASTLIACGAFAGGDANLMKYVNILYPDKEAGPTTVAGSAIDISSYKGNSTFVVSVGDGSAVATNTITLAHCATSGGTYATITNLAGTVGVITNAGTTNSMDTYQINLDRLHKYVKASYTSTGTNSAVSVILVAPMKSE